MHHSNIRYSTTLNAAQLDYLSDNCQGVNRMLCLTTFIRMAVLEKTVVERKGFSAGILPGQFIASKAELARLWNCDRKTATRIVREFNLIGILNSEPTNRTTIHTLKCLSVWFTNQGMIKCDFFVSNPVVRTIEKPPRNKPCVPPGSRAETATGDRPPEADSAGAQPVRYTDGILSSHSDPPLSESEQDD